jgi:hypothetical protein
VKTFLGIDIETFGEGINESASALIINISIAEPGFDLVDLNLAAAL